MHLTKPVAFRSIFWSGVPIFGDMAHRLCHLQDTCANGLKLHLSEVVFS